MIDYDVIIQANCDSCNKILIDRDDNINITCDNCLDDFRLKEMIGVMKNILSLKEWETFDGVGFKSDEDKKMFMKGIKYGMEHAFFWYASDHCGSEGIKLFEEIVGWKK